MNLTDIPQKTKTTPGARVQLLKGGYWGAASGATGVVVGEVTRYGQAFVRIDLDKVDTHYGAFVYALPHEYNLI